MNNRKLKVFIDEVKSDPVAIFSIAILSLIILGAILAFLSPYNPDKVDTANMLAMPSREHIFGTDALGRDYFTRAMYGARVSILVGISSVVISSFIGIVVGVVSGYFGGMVDTILSRTLDIFLSIPWLVLVSVISIFLKPGLISVIIVIGFFSWMRIARLVRAETISIKEREYILYIKSTGQTNFKIIFNHILPGIYPVFIVSSTIGIANAILTESTLSFLGLGIRPPSSSWGSMLQAARSNIYDSIYLTIFPGILIFLTIFAINKIGNIIRIAIEPKSGIGGS